MPARNPSLTRLLVNVMLDGALGALAVPLAFWLARPDQPLASGFAAAAGAVALIAGGVPFGLATQYWRFAGLGDMRAIAGSALAGETIVRTAESATITFPTFLDCMRGIGAEIQTID